MKKFALVLLLALMVISIPLGNIAAQNKTFKNGEWLAILDLIEDDYFVIKTTTVENYMPHSTSPMIISLSIVYYKDNYYLSLKQLSGQSNKLQQIKYVEFYKPTCGNINSDIIYGNYSIRQSYDFLCEKSNIIYNTTSNLLQITDDRSPVSIVEEMIYTYKLRVTLVDGNNTGYVFDISLNGFNECLDYCFYMMK